MHNAPSTYAYKIDAEAWLTDRRREIDRGLWSPPGEDAASAESLPMLAEYAETWLAARLVRGRPLKARTRAHYADLLDRFILPTFGESRLDEIDAQAVRSWYDDVLPEDSPTWRSHAYGLLRTMLGTAVSDGLISANPVAIRGAGRADRVHEVRPATLAELKAIVSAMPPRLRMMVLLGAWCAMRFGELAELRRGDIDLARGVIRVRRGVVRVDGGFEVGSPKSAAGSRDVAVPPHLVDALAEHLSTHVVSSRDGLLFPAAGGGHMAPASLYRSYYPARRAAGRPDLRFHDLRHTGAVLAAQTGATLAELMARLGHSTPAAAMRYQTAAAGRDAAIAAGLSRLAGFGEVGT